MNLPSLLLGLFLCLTVGWLCVYWLSPRCVPVLRRHGKGRLPPDLTGNYRDIYALLAVYGAPGVACWRRMLLFDLMFPCIYGPGLILAAHQWEPSPPWRAAGIAAAILCVAADYMENILLLRVIAALPEKKPALARGASVFTWLKFLLFAATVCILVAGPFVFGLH